MVRDEYFTCAALSPLLDYFGPDATPAANASVAIDPERHFLRGISQCLSARTIAYFSRNAAASAPRPSASSASAVTRAEALVQG